MSSSPQEDNSAEVNRPTRFNRLVLDVAKRRWLKKLVMPALPRIGYIEFPSGECLAIDTHDLRGPSFCLVNGWRNPEQALRSYEQEQRDIVEAFLRSRSSDGSGLTFLDVGANIGLFTFSAKRALPKLAVAAFEPHPVSAQCIRETVRRSGFSDVVVEQTALGRESGQFSLYLDESDSGGHSLDVSNLWNNRRNTVGLDVRVQTLDEWATTRGVASVDFLKIDVQGLEDDVIQGGLKILSQYKPGLLIEVQHEKVAIESAVVGSLQRLPYKYRVRSMRGEEGTYADLKEWSQREFQKGILFADYLFLPK